MRKLGRWVGALFVLTSLILIVLSLAAHQWDSGAAEARPTRAMATVNLQTVPGPQAEVAVSGLEVVIPPGASPDGCPACLPEGDSACSMPIAGDARVRPSADYPSAPPPSAMIIPEMPAANLHLYAEDFAS